MPMLLRKMEPPFLPKSIRVNAEDPEGLVDFLRRIVVFERNLRPDFESIKQEFGKNSIVWKQAEISLQKLWEQVRENPRCQIEISALAKSFIFCLWRGY